MGHYYRRKNDLNYRNQYRFPKEEYFEKDNLDGLALDSRRRHIHQRLFFE